MLVGRFVSDNNQAPAAAKNVAIAMQGLPAAMSCVTIDVQRIPFVGPELLNGSDPIAQPLAAPQSVDRYSAKVSDGKVTAFLPAFRGRTNLQRMQLAPVLPEQAFRVQVPVPQ